MMTEKTAKAKEQRLAKRKVDAKHSKAKTILLLLLPLIIIVLSICALVFEWSPFALIVALFFGFGFWALIYAFGRGAMMPTKELNTMPSTSKGLEQTSSDLASTMAGTIGTSL